MITTFSFSEPGGHATNEDAQEVRAHPRDSRCHVAAVADGQGGRTGGRQAARLAAAAAVDAACAQDPLKLAKARFWPTLLRDADAAAAGDPDAGYTTLVALAMFPDALAGASNGDSAAVAIVGGEHHILTSNQIRNPPVGSGVAPFVPFACRLRAPWQVLTMSDGVWKYAGWEAILDIAASHSGMELVEALARKARLPTSGQFQDDFTVVLAESGP